MEVQDVMTSSVSSVRPTDSIGNAAQAIADYDVAVLPVLDGQKLVGIVTDRDIAVRAAVRAVATGIDAERPIRLVMTEEVMTCSADTGVEDALELMSYEQVRRLPGCNADRKIVGIVALADAAHRDPDKREVAEAWRTFPNRAVFTVSRPYLTKPS